MKELRIKIGFSKEQKSTKEEKEFLKGTMTVLARVVDDTMYNAVMKSGLDMDLYSKALERISYSYEEGDLAKAKEQLYMIACLVDFDAAFILENLPDIRWHDLRASFCTLLLTNDYSPKAVSMLMGHAKEIITLDVYTDNMQIIADGVMDLQPFIDDVLPKEEEKFKEISDVTINLDFLEEEEPEEKAEVDIDVRPHLEIVPRMIV